MTKYLFIALVVLLLWWLVEHSASAAAASTGAVHGNVTEGDGFSVTYVDPSSVDAKQPGTP